MSSFDFTGGVTPTRVLFLNDHEHQASTVYRLQKGWILQFRLGPSVFGKKVDLYTNYPSHTEDKFERCKYRQVPWNVSSTNPDDDTAVQANINIFMAGSFHYYFTYDRERQGSGYFLVDPQITYGKENKVLPLDSILCQTVLTKCLGTFDEWKERLRVTKEAGFNMIHFTPIQELGNSLSAYSLADQLKLNSMFSTKDRQYAIEDVAQLVESMRKDWEVVSICDIVLNHSANESPWIQEHPECAYNLRNSPHMRPAFLLDRVLAHFTMEIAEGKWVGSGIPKEITLESQLQSVRDGILGYFLPQVKIHELYMVDVKALLEEFKKQASEGPHPHCIPELGGKVQILQDPLFRRYGSTVAMGMALQAFNGPRYEVHSEEERLLKCCQAFRLHLKFLNREKHKEVEKHIVVGVENILSGMRYERIQEDGPKIKEVSEKHPLICRYFTCPYRRLSLSEEEKLMFEEGKCDYMMAHNGWVVNHDPLINFAEPGSNVYLRRELIAWGDSVKLRFGERPEDNPFLWNHMVEYAKETARVFHGIRLDNCHSTPIHVAEYMLDAARSVRPDLYVIAELFTQSELTDNVFVNRLGINSLIREAMSAWDSHEEGRLVYRYGGEPVGAFLQPPIRPLAPSVAHAIFLDQTHDNPSPVQKRSIYDVLPSAALVSMACCASGSNRGYDELVPHHIHVVNENRQYQSWDMGGKEKTGTVSMESGIMRARKVLNELHFELGLKGFSQVFVDQVSEHVVAVTRHCMATHETYVLVAHTAFTHPKAHHKPRNIRLQGDIVHMRFMACFKHQSSKGNWDFREYEYEKDEKFINGASGFCVELRENFPISECPLIKVWPTGEPDSFEVEFTDFPPGSVICFKVLLHKDARNAVGDLRGLLSQLGYSQRAGDESETQELQNIIAQLSLADLNHVLYRCDAEEQDLGYGGGAYVIHHIGAFEYCGLQGLMTCMGKIRLENDLGHPLCGNLRDGNWLMDYVTRRLKQYRGTEALGLWVERIFKPLKCLPRYLIPSYFDAILLGLYNLCLKQIWSCMSLFVGEGSDFVKAVALGSVQMGGIVHSAPLPPLSGKLPLGQTERTLTLAAGLPHFATQWMRTWGRDTFIALRGLFLLTGRFQEARALILAYGGCLRHGLIPNLLSGGSHARYNCRDAIWWWLQCIQDYTKLSSHGIGILEDPVLRLYPTDDSPPLKSGNVEQPLHDVIQEALQRHFQGMAFRERNSGMQLDMQMTSEGFNVAFGTDYETGFIFGGNVHNCGTWMDKMGSSEKAGNKGKPASPRDGSAVELIGLSKSTLRWLKELHQAGKYPYEGVKSAPPSGEVTAWSWKEWEECIGKNFEKYFWINTTPVPENEPKPELINRRGIYKDSLNATQPWADYQLRCNFPIAMVVAPEMFDPNHAWTALDMAEKILLGPLGMKTLDPSDWAYRGHYNNADDSNDSSIAKGFNYHQGPEWLWPVGYFLRAKLHFAQVLGGSLVEETKGFVKSVLSHHFIEVTTSQWRGLPELTNANGAVCHDSCRTQAWSMSTILEV
ncbi:unnamed protein product [Darwinula stevensoni]|uniref:Glycogen debranching enzyme n=1 Tax=Darwinula stevensoni TaxID=69355 RepID=A0A7R9A2X9_9CRUS|nr:unnamed protein product [Darwinula stevensoni]CAG0880925.1 unnamed protein product [Darwinula stevensoni]